MAKGGQTETRYEMPHAHACNAMHACHQEMIAQIFSQRLGVRSYIGARSSSQAEKNCTRNSTIQFSVSARATHGRHGTSII